MRKMLLILLLTFTMSGCESARKTTNDKIGSNKAFPKALAAVWEGYYSQIDWVIKFTPDGKIEYAKIPWGGQFVGPNSEFTFPVEDNNNGMVVKTGKFEADYNPEGTLSVSIEIINFEEMTSAGQIGMKGTEYIIGSVDLEKGIWNAEWFTDGGYWVTPYRAKRIELPNDDNESRPLTLKRLIRKDEPRIPRSLEPNLPQSVD
jgi:hypothetical protein